MKKIKKLSSKQTFLLGVLSFLENLFDFDVETEYNAQDIHKIKSGITEIRSIILKQK